MDKNNELIFPNEDMGEHEYEYPDEDKGELEEDDND